MGLDERSKAAPTPSVTAKVANEEPLPLDQAVMYRALVARANYLSQDRSDIAFAVKELCRSMSDPSESDWMMLKRLARYLIGRSRIVVEFGYQARSGVIDAWTDTDFAGCHKTRKSTSGGVIMLCTHMIKGLEHNSGHHRSLFWRGGVLTLG